MKFSTIFLASLTSAETKSQWSDVIKRLDQLDAVTTEIIFSEKNKKSQDWKDNFFNKVGLNVDRMIASYERCGTPYGYNVEHQMWNTIEYSQTVIEFDSSNPCGTLNELMNGYDEWVEHISTCEGQKNHSHQKNRMKKWRKKLNKGPGFEIDYNL